MSQYQSPPVEVGDTVLWYSDGDVNTSPAPAIVTKVGNGRVSLTVFVEHVINVHPPTGVMHAGDPRIKSGGYNGSGAWEHRRERRDRESKKQETPKTTSAAKKA